MNNENAEEAFDEWWVPFQKSSGAPDNARGMFLAAFAYGICWSSSVPSDVAISEFMKLDKENR